MPKLVIQEVDEGVVFTAKIVPGGSRTAICGLLGKMLKIKVAAAPEKGQANRHLLEFLAKRLRVKKNAISIVSGKTGPVKGIRVLGFSAEMLLKKLNLNELRS